MKSFFFYMRMPIILLFLDETVLCLINQFNTASVFVQALNEINVHNWYFAYIVVLFRWTNWRAIWWNSQGKTSRGNCKLNPFLLPAAVDHLLSSEIQVISLRENHELSYSSVVVVFAFHLQAWGACMRDHFLQCWSSLQPFGVESSETNVAHNAGISNEKDVQPGEASVNEKKKKYRALVIGKRLGKHERMKKILSWSWLPNTQHKSWSGSETSLHQCCDEHKEKFGVV